MSRVVDLTGRRFGKLVVAERNGSTASGNAVWACKCDCGQTISVRGHGLLTNNTNSCGCARKKHGKSKTAEYRTWQAIIQRCYNPKTAKFHRYGGRGISMCLRWQNSFDDFLADMGPRPSPRHSIDRFPNPDGNYGPANCRWATAKQQNSNLSKQKGIQPCTKTHTIPRRKRWARKVATV